MNKNKKIIYELIKIILFIDGIYLSINVFILKGKFKILNLEKS
jgi:hypothetical protein